MSLTHLPLIVAERGADFPDALEEAVLTDMNAGPDRRHQLLLAEHPPGIGGKQPEHVERLRSKLYRFAVRPRAVRRAADRAQNQQNVTPCLPDPRVGAAPIRKGSALACEIKISEKLQNAINDPSRVSMRLHDEETRTIRD